MRLFDQYLNELDSVLSKGKSNPSQLIDNQFQLRGLNNKEIQRTEFSEPTPSLLEGPKVLFTYDSRFIENRFGPNSHSFPNITLGPHPDFEDLGHTLYINHHCVSVFVDIKGSTRLIEKYSLLEVRLIKDSLLTLAIQVANQFGGHVHRLQGDGVFLQFVRRGKNENDAIINALNATSILAQFVSKDLAGIMRQHTLNPLKIRIGIDFGKTDQVLWSYYGIPGCNELTTTSLHTDMAAKLQAKADDNSILIGGNVRDQLDLKSEFYSIYESQISREKVYYISNQFTYKFFVFNWQEYLSSLPYIRKSSDGKTLDIVENQHYIECYISNEDGSDEVRYYPNSCSIPKGKKITYYLKFGNSLYVKKAFENIEWYAYNSGKEAEDNRMKKHNFDNSFYNKSTCVTAAAFLGHHYVECKIIRGHSGTERITFPIFVQ